MQRARLRARELDRAAMIATSAADKAAVAAAATIITGLYTSAEASAEAKYTAGPGARKRPPPAGTDEERSAKKTRDAHLSRFGAKAYEAGLEAACAAGENELAALDKELSKARAELWALRWDVLSAENTVLRRRVHELEALGGEGAVRGSCGMASESPPLGIEGAADKDLELDAFLVSLSPRSRVLVPPEDPKTETEDDEEWMLNMPPPWAEEGVCSANGPQNLEFREYPDPVDFVEHPPPSSSRFVWPSPA